MSNNRMIYGGGPSPQSMNRTPDANSAPVGMAHGQQSQPQGYNKPAAPHSQSYDSHVQKSHQSPDYQPQMSAQDSRNLYDVRPQTRQPEIYGQTAQPQMMGQFYNLRKMQNPWGF